jgi:hypothetical protein
MMDENATDEVLNELFSALESAETQSGAILQFLKDKNLATDEDLAPYLQQAGNASSVRWMAARVRIRSLLASAIRNAEQEIDTKVEKAVHKKDETPRKQEEPVQQEIQKDETGQKKEQLAPQEAQGKSAELDARKQGDAQAKVDAREQANAPPTPEKSPATGQEQPPPSQSNSDQKKAAPETGKQENVIQKNADQKVA